MRTPIRLLSGFMIASAFISCEKSNELDIEALQMELESCKPGKKNLAIGMEYQGGIIFYLDETGKHGLIAAKEDVGPAPWGCYGTYIPGVDEFLDDSKMAARMLLAGCKEQGIVARLCAKYEVREKGKNGRVYKDWYMAGADELFSLSAALGAKADMCGKNYWTYVQQTEFLAIPKDPAKSVRILGVSCTAPPNPFQYGFFLNSYKKTALAYARPIRDF